MKNMTALVRNGAGNLSIVRDDYFSNQKQFSQELRANGFRVLKIWSRDVTNGEVWDWEFMNRK